MDIITKAKELGEMIASCNYMLRLKAAEERIEEDNDARKLLSEYKQLQIEMVKAVKENKDKNIIENIKQELLLKQQIINSNNIIKEYLEAKASLDDFMKTINETIIFAITGEEPCSPRKCSSCGGCK